MNKYYENEYSSDEEIKINSSDDEINNNKVKNDYYINNDKNIINNNYKKIINAPKKKIFENNNNNDNKMTPKILFPEKVDDEAELNKFLGFYDDDTKYKNIISKNDWKHCDYCEKRHGKEYFLKNISYCMLCWSWLNINDVNLETGEYTGELNFEDIKTMLKKTYLMYNNVPEKNINSIYVKINSYKDAGILHTTFKKLLGFEEEKKNKEVYLIYNKSRKLNINYEKNILEI
jgi:hypothetical protein